MLRGFSFLFLVVVAFQVGCGPSTGGRVGVEGKVTHRGQPLEKGTIEFISEDGSQMAGATIAQGQYTLPAETGIKPGKFIVRVSSIDEGQVQELEAAGDSLAAEVKELIPEEYNVNSKLSADIGNNAMNQYNVDIP